MDNDLISDDFDSETRVIANSNVLNFISSMDLDIDVKTRLSRYLRNVEPGSDVVLTTPLAKDRSPDDILKGWDEIFQSNLHRMNNPLLKLEDSNRSKYGPRSISKPWNDRKSSVLEYFNKENSSVYPVNSSRPKDLRARLRPISLSKASEFLKNSTNSGLPYFTKKGKVKERVVANFERLLSRQDPAILFTRTQESLKTRNVWGFPIADTLNEMMYYRPLLDYQRKLSWRSALVGPNEVDRRITEIFKSKSPSDTLLSIDFSAYDASLKSRLQKSAFGYIKTLFQDEYWDNIDYIAHRFNTIGIVTPSGIITGSHGVPSGSTFTNEVDSIAQFQVAMCAGFVNPDKLQIQGDDGVYCIKTSQVSDLVDLFSSSGLSVNESKSLVSSDYCVYLQNLYHPDYTTNGLISGVYPTYRALSRLVFQERWSGFEDFGLEGKDYYSLRAISILENCKNHPLFEELVRYIKSIDKYSLGVSRSGIDKYRQYIIDSRGAEGFLLNQYGDDIKGIKSFRTMKVLGKL